MNKQDFFIVTNPTFKPVACRPKIKNPYICNDLPILKYGNQIVEFNNQNGAHSA